MKFRVALLAAVLLLASLPAFSQGCAMCYSTAAASTQEGQKAVSKGVMVLLIPPLGFMTLGVWMAFRYGRKRDLEQAERLDSPFARNGSLSTQLYPSNLSSTDTMVSGHVFSLGKRRPSAQQYPGNLN